MRKSQHGYNMGQYIPRISWVGSATDTNNVPPIPIRNPLTKWAGFAFNRIANTCPNAMAYWSLVQQGRATAQKHVGDTLTGHRSVEAVAQGGEKPHAAPFERTDKLATGENTFNTKENKNEKRV